MGGQRRYHRITSAGSVRSSSSRGACWASCLLFHVRAPCPVHLARWVRIYSKADEAFVPLPIGVVHELRVAADLLFLHCRLGDPSDVVA